MRAYEGTVVVSVSMCLESRDSFITVGFQKMSRAWKENLGILEDERLKENLSLGLREIIPHTEFDQTFIGQAHG